MVPRHLLAPALALTIAVTATADGAEDPPAADRQGPVSATDLIRARCIFCHGAPVLLAFSQRTLDAGGAAALDALLARHHAPDPAARAAIVEFFIDPMGGSGQ